MRKPSPKFQAWLRKELDEQRATAGQDDEMRQLGIKNEMLPFLVHGLNVWFVAMDGSVHSFDLDTVSRNLDPTDETGTQNILEIASKDWPQLRELIED